MAQNQSAQNRLAWIVHNAAATEADIDIFDRIGDPYEGTTASDFVKTLRGLKNVARINLHINSPGGMVSDGLSMYAALKQHPAQIVAYVESQAGSAASFVAMAADKVAIFPNAKIEIHDAQVPLLIGASAADMRLYATMLDEESNNIAAIYAEKASGTVAEWREAMQANDGQGTTYRGEEAVTARLADEVVATARNYDPARIAAYVSPSADHTHTSGDATKVRSVAMPNSTTSVVTTTTNGDIQVGSTVSWFDLSEKSPVRAVIADDETLHDEKFDLSPIKREPPAPTLESLFRKHPAKLEVGGKV